MILAPLALFLVWEVITRSVAAYLADANPRLAIRLRANQSHRTLEPRRQKSSNYEPGIQKSSSLRVDRLLGVSQTTVIKGIQSTP